MQANLTQLNTRVNQPIKIFNRDNIGLKMIDLIRGFDMVLDNRPLKYSQAGSKHKLKLYYNSAEFNSFTYCRMRFVMLCQDSPEKEIVIEKPIQPNGIV